MKTGKIVQRFLLPSPIISLYYFFKFKCYVSVKAEVELSRNLTIGKNTKISSFCKVKASDGLLIIGSNVSIASGCFISSLKRVEIGNDCLIGRHVCILGGSYKYDRINIPIRNQGHNSKGTKIGNNVWIGSGSCIVDGSKIGDGVIVAPNTVVSSKVPDNAIVQGNLGKVIFTRRE